jgi:rhodanese-related sulfurtransferase
MKTKIMQVVQAMFWLLCLSGGSTAAGAAQPDAGATFPLREQYRDVSVIETAELAKRFNDVIIVDVRSQYEYDTLRIKDAQLIPIGDPRFISRVKELRTSNDKAVIFYCNGKTCHKSYDAVRKAQAMRIKNVYCYDAGVADWAKANPERAALLGISPVKTEKLISRDRFKEHLLEPAAFESKVAGAIVLDVRDRTQRDNFLFPFKEQRVQMDETVRIDAVINQARREKKVLLVYDAVGRQVEWFQYHLESRGLKDYYFMKGGAQAYVDMKGKTVASQAR